MAVSPPPARLAQAGTAAAHAMPTRPGAFASPAPHFAVVAPQACWTPAFVHPFATTAVQAWNHTFGCKHNTLSIMIWHCDESYF
ncbi:unnamed protein product [Leptosia nina]|uniref:Uncharacterized protein n=1 Tax=Leptosia nina TaxID=320188 RepID=A0AAV1IWK0_9NEOP